MVEVAALFGRAAADAGSAAIALQGHLVNVGALATSAIDPVGAARFEEELALALDGPHGLAVLAMTCAAMAAGVRAAAAAYRDADDIDTEFHTAFDGVLGLPRAAWRTAATVLETGSAMRGLNAFATADPQLCDTVGEWAATVGATSASGLVLQGSDGGARVRDLGEVDAPTGTAPKDLDDVVQGLATRNAGASGEIDVRFVYRADGSRSVIVDVPGTKSWDPLPTSDVTSLVTNVRAVQGEQTSYSRGVLEAMRRAGVRPDDPVMLVGHSEGGMVAARVAIDASASKEFDVTHVVTAGAPIGRFAAEIRDSVQVLAIENKHDVVPHLDGSANPARTNITTVTVDHDHQSVIANHDIDLAYVPGARDIEASGDPSIHSYLSGAGGFFNGTGVRTHRFQISRGY
jgi:hypothetical protein